MQNYFQELKNQGIEETEISIKQAYDLYDQGRINTNQLEKILINNLGEEKFIELTKKALEEYIGINCLSSPIPEFTNDFFCNPEKGITHSTDVKRMERPKSNDSNCV